MYPYIEMAVRPSTLLIRSSWLLLTLLLFSLLPFFDSRLVYLVPLLLVLMGLVWALLQQRFEFQQSGFWLVQNDQWLFGDTREEVEAVEMLRVDRLLPFITVLHFRRPNRSVQRQVLVADRVMAEPFRQFRVMLKQRQLST